MEREHAIAVLERLHRSQRELYGGGDDSAVRDALTPDVVWHVPGDSAISGEYRGLDAVLAYFRHRRDLAGSTIRMTVREILTGPDDHVAALTDGTATLDGVEHTWSTVGLYRLRGDRVAECRLLPLAPEAFDAIWTDRTPVTVHQTPVRPRHCDAQGMMHASRYYEYFEDAFLAWLDDHIGGYNTLRATGTDLVVVASGCDHHRGAALGERLAIEVRPVAAGRTSLSMAFTVRGETGDVLAEGKTTYVAVTPTGAVELPALLRAHVP